MDLDIVYVFDIYPPFVYDKPRKDVMLWNWLKAPYRKPSWMLAAMQKPRIQSRSSASKQAGVQAIPTGTREPM